MAYVYGCRDVNKSLGTAIEPNPVNISKSVYKEIDGKTWEQRLKQAETFEELKRIAETESHRDFSEGQYDIAIEGGATHKTWLTMRDDRVRESHWYLDGLKVEINEFFCTLAGERAMHPQGFGVADEDCNCRCYLRYTKE